MTSKKTGKKGFETEELLRSYFLEAGFFVVRGIILENAGDTLTDIDLWIYERSTTLARRRTIIDIKDNQDPKAAERLFFIKGLAEVLRVEGAGVATSDGRASLRDFARKNSVLWLDNWDIQRLKTSQKLNSSHRITEELMRQMVSLVDKDFASKAISSVYNGIKNSIANRFGPSCANTALEGAGVFARLTVEAHPNSDVAIVAGRLTYFAISVAAAALDFYSAETALRPYSDRLVSFTKAIRYGDSSSQTDERLKWTEMAIREYAPGGIGTAAAVREGFEQALQSVPAEGFAQVVVKLAASSELFRLARAMEDAAFSINVPCFDELEIGEKSLLAAVLDFVGIDRARFADAWEGTGELREQALNTRGVDTDLDAEDLSVKEESDLEK